MSAISPKMTPLSLLAGRNPPFAAEIQSALQRPYSEVENHETRQRSKLVVAQSQSPSEHRLNATTTVANAPLVAVASAQALLQAKTTQIDEQSPVEPLWPKPEALIPAPDEIPDRPVPNTRQR